MSLFALFLLVAAVCVALQALAWLLALRLRNWSVVDPAWAASLAACALLAALLGAGDPARRAAVAAAGLAWGGRHAWLLLRHRVLGHPEEGRYAALRRRWGAGAFLAFFQAQALLAAGLAWPFLLAADARAPFGARDVLALLVVAAGLAFEALADAQLRRHKADPAQRGRTCRVGLWAWSRHPNYVGEVGVWLGFASLAGASPHGLWAFAAPAVLLLLILFVTGIPPSERQALATRGDDYRRYQAEVSRFLPWPPRRGESVR